MMMVLQSGMSRPFSMMVVATRTSDSWRMKLSITFSSSPLRHLSVAHDRCAPAAPVPAAWRRSHRWSPRGCGRSRPGRRAPVPARCADWISFSSQAGDHGLDGQAVLGRRLDHAHVAQADQRHVQRARDGRGGHGEHVHFFAASASGALCGGRRSAALRRRSAGPGRGT